MSYDPTESFRKEAVELIEQLEAALMKLEEGDHSKDVVDEAFRAMHTIKGSGSMFGFEEVAAFVHHFENAFDQVREGKLQITDQLTDASLQALDYIQEMLSDKYDQAKAASILALLDGSEETAQPVSAKNRFEIVFYPGPDTLKVGGNPALILDEIRALGSCEVEILDERLPAFEEFDYQKSYLGWKVILETDQGKEALDDIFLFYEDDSELTITEVTEKQELKKQEDVAEAKQSSSTTVKISSERLDLMMDQVGELVIAQSRLAELSEHATDPALRAVSEDIERLVMDLRDQTLGIRMMPIGMLFSRFKRVVRDLSKDLNKNVELICEGEETEVDKTFIDKLQDPIVHLIRNSMDHGLEDEATRLSNGKTGAGTLRLSATQTGGEVLVSITDDGRGLNEEKIRQKAISSGLISDEDQLEASEIHQLIFQAGFSTADSVSSVSGRGVGMDVVRRTIEELRGKIDVKSTSGEGSTITLRLPLTLAIIEGYHVKVGGEVFVLPLELVEECVELTPEDDQASEGRSLISIRDEFVPFIRMHDALGMEYNKSFDYRVVVVRVGGERTGLVVDKIFGQRQTVIKPLSKLHNKIKGLAGATILGDGSVALILDIPKLLEKEKEKNARRAA